MDEELNVLRQKLKGGAEAVALPASENRSSDITQENEVIDLEKVKVEEVDNELEELKREIDTL